MGMGFTQPFRHVIWIKIWEWDQFVTPGLLPQIREFIVTEHCHAWYRGAALQWRHNGNDGVWNHQPYHCLLNCLFGRRSKKTSKLRVASLWVRNLPGTGEFPAQMASNAENVSIRWRHHGLWINSAIYGSKQGVTNNIQSMCPSDPYCKRFVNSQLISWESLDCINVKYWARSCSGMCKFNLKCGALHGVNVTNYT